MSKAGSICVFCCYFNDFSEILYEYRNSDSSAFPQGGNEDQYSAVDETQDCRLLRAEGAPRSS